MKRWIIGLIMCLVAFFVTREITVRFGEPFFNFGVRLPSPVPQQSPPTKAEAISALPSLTNLTLRPARQPSKTDLAPSTNKIEQASDPAPVMVPSPAAGGGKPS